MRFNLLTILGILLVIAGALGLAGVGIPTNRSVVEMGPMQATVQENRTIPPVLAVVLLLAGVGAVVVGQKKA
jgi:hypothetical protein